MDPEEHTRLDDEGLGPMCWLPFWVRAEEGREEALELDLGVLFATARTCKKSAPKFAMLTVSLHPDHGVFKSHDGAGPISSAISLGQLPQQTLSVYLTREYRNSRTVLLLLYSCPCGSGT